MRTHGWVDLGWTPVLPPSLSWSLSQCLGAALQALRRERDTLSEALAAVAEAAVGGQDVSPNQIADEAAIAVAVRILSWHELIR